ncbi:Thiamine pyrophosphate binding protein [Novymonas esmeraldas]|uniref:Thiamine pyrophosphate binding protein n=1 Tax=Novymonas esmeraldas TaxID=1808958 RepID=A0AAW0ENV8_9TRYP
MPVKDYNIGCYLLQRLVKAGVGHLFGVPGDYNLRFLDDVTAQKDLEWVGCANELNAAYAADGYAKCRHLAAILTTYGVGELSAVNGIAGAYAERNPVIHIVGGPATTTEKARAIMHHTLGDGEYEHFLRMSTEVSCATCHLNFDNAKAEIDRVIEAALFHKKPGYILLPMDVAVAPAEAPTTPLCFRDAPTSAEVLGAFEAAVEGLMKDARSAVALIGHLCNRFGCSEATQALVEESAMPFAHMLLGKGTLCEQSAQFVGTYYGKPSIASVRETVEEADVCVIVGVKFHDLGTGFFSHKIDQARRIDIQPFESTVGDTTFSPLGMKDAVAAVRAIAKAHAGQWTNRPVPRPPAFPAPESDAFSMRHFWNELQGGLREGDIVVVDQGTSSCSSAGLVLPKNGLLLSQALWGSIGYSLPAAFGAQVANPNRRVIVVVGDGAAAMTVQELGSFLRRGLRPIVFLVNNDGYVIERVIHGWNEEYNDIASWDWCTVMKGMCGGKKAQIQVVKDTGLTADVLREHLAPVKELVFSEVMLGRHEPPVVTLANW